MKYADRKIDEDARALTCANCVYLKEHSTYDLPCAESGAKPEQRVCERFVFNVERMPATKRIAIIGALNALADAKVSATELEGLIYNAKRLKQPFALGGRAYITYGREPYKMTTLCTVVGRHSGNSKLIMWTPTGGVAHVSTEGLKVYTPSEIVDTSFQAYDFPASKKEQIDKIDGKLRSFKLRGDDGAPAEAEPASTEKRKRGRPPKNAAQPTAKRRTQRKS